ncbi:MAG TPA: ferrochelatase [Candidatus Baltobacteraceae bacterium]|nr:ferrochelatase [Candidatus Baltobacteraceae bacterium]
MQVVLLGYGGPESLAEVRPFLERITAGRRIPQARLEQVVGNYEAIGGKSPFNELTRKQAAALEIELGRRGTPIPVRVAYRFMPPFITDVAREARERENESVAVILAVHQSEASWDKYVELFPDATFAQPFSGAQGFVDAHEERIYAALAELGRHSFDDTALIFTAHSIPVEMSERSRYAEQLRESAELIAARFGSPPFHIAYTSRSGNPAEQWLEPDVRDLLRDLAKAGVTEAVIDPAGFVCDHVEVLYDLDVDAAAVARDLGIRVARAQALNDHPAFISALADRVQACIG